MSAGVVGPRPVGDTGLACLEIVARVLGVPTESRGVLEPGVAPADDRTLVRLGRALGLGTRLVETDWARLRDVTLPAIAAATDGSYLVLAGVDGTSALVQDPREDRPRVLSADDFRQRWTRRLIVCRRPAAPGARRAGLAWFLPAIVKYRRLLIEVVCASLVLQLFALLTPLFTQVVIDKVLVHRSPTTLHVMASGMLALLAFAAILAALRAYVFAHTGARIDVELGSEVFRHLLALPLAYFEARRAGDTVARVRELESVRQLLMGATLATALDMPFAAVLVAVMLLYSAQLTAVALAVLPLSALLALLATPMLRARVEEKLARGAESHAFLVESVAGIQTVKALAVEPSVQRGWDDRLAAYVRAGLRATAFGSAAGQSVSLLDKIGALAVLWVGAQQVMAGRLSVGELIAFTMLASRVSAPVLGLVQLWQDLQQAGIAIGRLRDVLDAAPERSRVADAHQPARVAGRVRFEGVSFRYGAGGPEVLRDVSFAVPAGSVVGIVGRSGSGKSTVGKLLQRLYVPERGRVLVDGIDLGQVEPAWLRRQVGLVLQESFLFNRSVRENIALTDPGMSAALVVAAARLAGAHEFILRLPEGYETVVGDRGALLSGGQRQRLAIARALAGDPAILVLDEATSALDYESERAVQDNLERIRQGRTVIVIAHRLTTVRRADRILVMDAGRIVEAGTHDELVARGGLYAALHRLQ
jgi:subfamily B ATP-binding cassette protein HlyB/CyaB